MQRQLPTLFYFHSLASTQRMKYRALGNERERSGDGVKAWAKQFYLSAAWEQTRAAYLLSQDFICERCGEPAKIVHHKRWLNRENINDTEVALSWDNLEALCQDCHNKEHHKQDKERRYRFDESGGILPPSQKQK